MSKFNESPCTAYGVLTLTEPKTGSVTDFPVRCWWRTCQEPGNLLWFCETTGWPVRHDGPLTEGVR